MTLAALFLAFTLWPVHIHRGPAPAQDTNVSTLTVVGAQDDAPQDRPGCEVSPEFGYMYAGADGVAGFSFESCEAAYQDWRHTPASKTVLLRA